jgi:protease-4
VRRLKQERETPDLSTFAGITAFWAELMQGENRVRHPRTVAVVELEGMILDGDVSAPGYSICGNDTAALFDKLVGDSTVVAVVVRINSGGGSADASDRMHYALRRLSAAKPVVVLFDAVAASGGYYVGCAGREIMVHRGTITGSIGVFAVVPDLEGTRALFGIKRHTIATDPRADLFKSTGFGPEKEAGFRQVVKAVDARFQGIVAERRKLAPEKVHELAGGRVYTGDEAVANGLADRLGDLPAAVARARELAGIAEPLPLERLPRSGGLAARLGLGGVASGLVPAALPPGLRLWWEIAQAERLAVMAWTPAPGIR